MRKQFCLGFGFLAIFFALGFCLLQLAAVLHLPYSFGLVAVMLLCPVSSAFFAMKIRNTLFPAVISLKEGSRLVVLVPSKEDEFLMALPLMRSLLFDANNRGWQATFLIRPELVGYLRCQLNVEEESILITFKDRAPQFNLFERIVSRLHETSRLADLIESREFDSSLQLSESWQHSIAVALASVPVRMAFYPLRRRFHKRTDAFLLRKRTDAFLRSVFWTSGAAYSLGKPKLHFYRDQSRNLGLDQRGVNSGWFKFPRLYVLASSRINVAQILKERNGGRRCFSYIVIEPGGAKKGRKYPRGKFVKLISDLRQAGFRNPFVLSFRPGEKKLRARMEVELQSIEDLIFLDELDLDSNSFVAMCANSLLTISNAGAASHIARMAGAPSVSFCGRTDFEYVKYQLHQFTHMIMHPSKKVKAISGEYVFRRCAENINHMILLRRIAVVVKESGGTLDSSAATLSSKIANCRDLLSNRAVAIGDEVYRSGVEPDMRVPKLERLGLIHHLLAMAERDEPGPSQSVMDQHEDSARRACDELEKLGGYRCREDDIFVSYPLGIFDRTAGPGQSLNDILKTSLAAVADVFSGLAVARESASGSGDDEGEFDPDQLNVDIDFRDRDESIELIESDPDLPSLKMPAGILETTGDKPGAIGPSSFEGDAGLRIAL